jgi:high-affinity nickel permease
LLVILPYGRRRRGWAQVKPRRKLVYNLAITLFSILVALIIVGLEYAHHRP